jgi:hypothetical protein
MARIAPDTQARASPGVRPSLTLVVAAAGSLALPILGWVLTRDVRDPGAAAFAALAQVSYLASGWLVVWRIPGNRIGPLLIIIGLLDLSALGLYSDVPAIDTVAWVLLGAGDIVLIILVLLYPTGHFEDRVDRAVGALLVGLMSATWIIELLAADPPALGCEACLPNPFLILDPSIRLWWGRTVMAPGFPIGGVVVAMLIARRWRRSSRPARVRLAPLLVAGVVIAAVVALGITISAVVPSAGPLVDDALAAARSLIPVALAVGLFRAWRRRWTATDRVATLALGGEAEALGPTVAEALGDPSATVVRWSSTLAEYVDRRGAPIALPDDRRAVTIIEERDEPLAAILHDPALADDPSLLAVVSGAVRLAILRERLREAVRYETADGLPNTLAAGEMIGGFRILRPLAHGGMGVVYLAQDDAAGRPIALKILASTIAADPDYRERFRREARMAAALDHPNVVTLLAAGEDAGRLYLAMRYVDGPDLHQLILAEGPLTPGRAVHVVAGIASALDAAHAAGIVHRDVKTSNILLEGRPERAFLADFGLARPMAAGNTLTRAGGFVGSLDTMAPERIRGEAPGPAADIYALGCVLHECLVGRAPFARDGELATLWAHLQSPAPLPSAERPGLPKTLDAVVARALAKDAAARYLSAGALAEAAREALGG